MSVVTSIGGPTPASSAPSAHARPALGPHALAQRVACHICSAAAGEPCRDGEDVRVDAHHSRWIAYQRASRTQPFLAVVLRDVDDDLREGDVVTCAPAKGSNDVVVLADSLGRLGRANPVSGHDVEFRGFVAASPDGDRRTLRPGAARRTHARTA